MAFRTLTFLWLFTFFRPIYGSSSPTASKCASPLQPSSGIKPSIASGYTWAIVATGLTSPRSLQFDSDDNLFVLESGKGVSKHTLKDNGGVCVTVTNSTNIIQDVNLNHGMVVAGTRIYVSSSELVYVVSTDSSSNVLANSNITLITGMAGTDHTTRTLLLPSGANDSIVVSRGSVENIDPLAESEASGHSSVKMFDLAQISGQPLVYNASGTVLGWGLRNDVGLAQHPTTGGLFAVENSVDQLTRDGQDVHEDNPGEELNFLGFIDGANSSNQGFNFGYPYCYTAWAPSELPDNSKLKVGTPFSPQSSNDSACLKTVAPRLTFQAHMAPIDMKFNNSATEAWISFHGSWDRTDPGTLIYFHYYAVPVFANKMPVGYSVAKVAFKSCGMPVQPPTSTTAADFIFGNLNISQCPGSCFRPAGLAFDSKGRLFVASDSSGEVYVVAADATSNGTSSGSSGSGSESTRRGSWWTIGVATAICIVAALI